MRYSMRMRTLLVLPALVGASACFHLSRGAAVPQQYVLGAGPVPATTQSPPVQGVTVGLRRPQLERYLDTPLLVIRKGPREITFSEFHRWAEPLASGINSAVARYMAGQAPIRAVAAAPWSANERYDYLIQLHVLRFEGEQADIPLVSSGEVHLLAAWEIISQDDGAVLARGTTDYRKGGWRAGDHEGLVAQLDDGLIALSKALVARIAEFPVRPPGSDSSRVRPDRR